MARLEHKYVDEERPPTPRERAVIIRLLGEEFPGVDALRGQLEDLRVSECDTCCSILFKIASATRADVRTRVPVEGHEGGAWHSGRTHVLLHVVNGLLDELEVFRENGTLADRLPSPDELQVVVNTWQDY